MPDRLATARKVEESYATPGRPTTARKVEESYAALAWPAQLSSVTTDHYYWHRFPLLFRHSLCDLRYTGINFLYFSVSGISYVISLSPPPITVTGIAYVISLSPPPITVIIQTLSPKPETLNRMASLYFSGGRQPAQCGTAFLYFSGNAHSQASRGKLCHTGVA